MGSLARSLVAFSPVLASLVAPSLAAQSSRDAAVEVNAVANTNPPSVTFTWPSTPTATNYSIARRAAGSLNWGAPVVVPNGGATTSWADTTVAIGERYEYRFIKTGGNTALGFVTAGVRATPIEARGKLVLLVDASHAAALASRIDRLTADLIGDGWQVIRHDVAPTEPVTNVKALILADYNADPANVNTVFILGHVPVPYSGNIRPDGHSNHLGAWAADVYYGEMNGTWTDASVNSTTASRAANRNVPGDGKFDQSIVPGFVELGVGRVDFANMPAFSASEQTLLERYLDKNHDYRHKVFSVEQRAIIDDNFGWFSGEAFAATGWRGFSALVGTSNVSTGDYFTTLNTTTGGGYAWSYGCGGGSYTSANGIGNTNAFTTSTNRNVFTILFGSYFGDWDSTNNFLRAPLCSGWTLSNAWCGRPHWSFHPMGLGETLGFCTRLSQNDTSAGGFGRRQVHVALMGDPTLRQHVIAPPTNVSVTTAALEATISWTASTDTVDGYHVYRAFAPAGPFTRLTSTAVTAETYTDNSMTAGHAVYMVRALRLETVPTGSYWNLSQGETVTTCLPDTQATHTDYGTGCYDAPPIVPLTISASPAPISTPTTGTLVGYTVANIPANPIGSSTYSGATILGFAQNQAGVPLTLIGMPDCRLYLDSIDVSFPFTSNSSTHITQVDVPPGVPCGTSFYVSAVAFIAPGSLPNGQNALGAVTSNGIASVVGNR